MVSYSAAEAESFNLPYLDTPEKHLVELEELKLSKSFRNPEKSKEGSEFASYALRSVLVLYRMRKIIFSYRLH